jgi:cation-transporting P-type ATPase I
VASVVKPARVIHRLPGRIRVHLPDRSWLSEHDLEARLEMFPGVSQVCANGQTGNVLITYDPVQTCEAVILASLASLECKSNRHAVRASACLHIAGASDDSQLTRRIAQRLEALSIVDSAVPQGSGGQVSVRYSHTGPATLELVAEAARTQAGLASRRRSGPGVETIARTGERSVEIAAFATEKFRAKSVSATKTASVSVAGAILLISAIPPARNGLRRLLGDTGAKLLLEGAELGGAALAGGWTAVMVGTLTALKLVRTATNRGSVDDRTRELELELEGQPPAMARLASKERLVAGKG